MAKKPKTPKQFAAAIRKLKRDIRTLEKAKKAAAKKPKKKAAKTKKRKAAKKRSKRRKKKRR